MKNYIGILNATPKKRFILSIVADYDLIRSICELIDNAIDIWMMKGKVDKLNILINFDDRQKTIMIKDNAGGVKKDDLEYLISPGATTNQQYNTTIGIFGVGTKRAVIALAEDIKITSRFGKEKTHLIEFDKNWLKDEDWDLPYFESNEIDENTTIVELSKLRMKITEYEIENLLKQIGKIYSKYLQNDNFTLLFNNELIPPINFENWAYPPHFEPKRFNGQIETPEGRFVNVEMVAGLMKESSPTSGEYGVYFYCNDRLIISALKSPAVGFIKRVAGLPDASLSLARIIVSLNGSAIDMPWNSSKSNIDTNHYTFNALRSWLFDLVKDYCTLSRRLKGDWYNNVFRFKTGQIINIPIQSFKIYEKTYALELPAVRESFEKKVKKENAIIEKNKIWTQGLNDAMIIVDHIKRLKLKTKYRIALIILDSNLEIALKEYLVHEVKNKHYSKKDLFQIFEKRYLVVKEIRKHINDKLISEEDWENISVFYDLRCSLIHERITINIDIEQIEQQQKLVEKILFVLFKLKF